MKHTFKPMTWDERHGCAAVPAPAEDKKTLPSIRIEMPEKMLKDLKLGDKVEVIVKGEVTELSTEFSETLQLDMNSVEIPGNAEVKALL